MKRPGLLALAAGLLVLIGVALAIADPFAGEHASAGIADNGTPTALQSVERRSLTARQTLTGTLGYAGNWTVAVPAGTSAADLRQAEQQEASARAAYVTAQASLADDRQTLEIAEAELEASQLKEESDCAGASSAVGAPCTNSMQATAAHQDTVTSAREKIVPDAAQLTAARATFASAGRALAAARSASSAYGSAATYTRLPSAGEVIRRGKPLYAIDGSGTLLLYGETPAWRSFAPGMPGGRDVAQLNANLRGLGFGANAGDFFTTSTEQAIEALQRLRGLPVTGSLPLGSVAFEPGAVRVTAVTPTVGQSVQPGPIMTLSSTRHAVSIQLDVSQQSHVRVRDRVLVTLPDNSTTPGIVASVGKVASTPAGGQGSDGRAAPGTPAIPVEVQLLHPGDAGTLDQAPVNVLVTTATLRGVLVVPVNALVATAGGGYALEEVTASGAHRLVRVTPGLFDDEEGLVQVQGSGVAAGQRVVVPVS